MGTPGTAGVEGRRKARGLEPVGTLVREVLPKARQAQRRMPAALPRATAVPTKVGTKAPGAQTRRAAATLGIPATLEASAALPALVACPRAAARPPSAIPVVAGRRRLCLSYPPLAVLATEAKGVIRKTRMQQAAGTRLARPVPLALQNRTVPVSLP